MNRFKRIVLAAILIGLSTGSGAMAAENFMSIQVKQGYLRSTPSFLGKIVAALDYAQRVAVLEKRDAWVRVRAAAGGAEGWLHVSALTTKRIVLKSGSADVQEAATSDELALAGKGFSRQVEGEFKAQNPQIDYTWIDRMEQAVVSETEMARFLQEGGLASKGGLK